MPWLAFKICFHQDESFLAHTIMEEIIVIEVVLALSDSVNYYSEYYLQFIRLDKIPLYLSENHCSNNFTLYFMI